MWEFKNRYRKMAILLTEFIEAFVSDDPEILNKQQDIYLNIDEM